MDTHTSLAIIERRIDALERMLLGDDDEEGAAQNVQVNEPSIVAALTSVSNELRTRTKGRTNIDAVFVRGGDVQKFTHPNYADAHTTVESRATIVSSSADALLTPMARRLATIDRLLPVLDSEHIRNNIKHMPTVANVAVKQIDTAEKVSTLTREVCELVDLYNDYVSQLNKQFVYWDNVITIAEKQQAAKIKK